MATVQSQGQLTSIQRAIPPLRPYGLTLYGDLTRDYSTLYRTQHNVRICVKFLARNIAQLALKVYRRVSDTDREQLADHDLAATLRAPNPFTTRYRLFSGLVHDLGIYGNHLWVKVPTPSGRLGLVRVPWKFVSPVGESWIYPERYELRGNRGRIELVPSQVVHFRFFHPDDERIGVSPLESLRAVLAEEAAAAGYREQMWNAGARVSGIIRRPPAKETGIKEWSRPARERFSAEWQARWAGSGPDAGGTPILEDGMEWVPAGFNAAEAQYLEARKLTREECAASFFIPPPMVGVLEHATYSNISEQHKNTYQDTLGPYLKMIEEDIELQLLPEFSDTDRVYTEFNIAEKLKGSFEEQAAAMQTMVGAPIMTRNEGRARLNLPSLPPAEGDVIVTPLNVLVGGLASPTDTAPPPKKRGRKARDPSPAVEAHVTKHRQVLGSFFNRQRRSVASALGASADLDAAFDEARWNDELGTDLLALGRLAAQEIGQETADVYSATYDVDEAGLPYLMETTRVAAENVNATTKEKLSQALADDDTQGSVGAVFDEAAGARTEALAISSVTNAGSFGRSEAAKAAGVLQKVWVVTSGNPRPSHASLDGEAVGIDDLFSNGARWPGDPTLQADEVAGCACDLAFE